MKLEDRILEISKKYQLSHIGSCITSVNIIKDIYEKMIVDKDIFILSNGHAGVALYVVLEKYLGLDAENLLEENGVHPIRNKYNHIYCTTGSLGMGLTVAIGYALADKDKKVYCLISDGELAEGSIWESFYYLTKYPLDNLEIHINMNTFTAYEKLDYWSTYSLIEPFVEWGNIKIHRTHYDNYKYLLNGIDAHYCKIRKEE